MSGKAKIYLYKEGNECTSLTGGYVESYSDTKSKTVTKTANSFKILKDSDNYANGGLYTKNKIDLKYASKLVYNLSAYSFAYVSPDNTGTTLGTSSQANYNITNFVDTISLEPTMGKNTYQVIPTKSSFHVLVRQGGIAGCRLDGEVHEIYYEIDRDIVSINSQDDSSINFSCSNLSNLITITKVEVYINNTLSETYNSNFDNITYTIDSSLYRVGTNNVKIKVTYTQGDEIYETVEKILTCVHNINLTNSSNLKELIDTQETITDTIEILKGNLKSNLESKSVSVSSSDKLSDLVSKVSNIALGKKWASGVASPPTTNKNFLYAGGTSSRACEYIVIDLRHLDFTPSFVAAYSYVENVEAISVLANAHTESGVTVPVVRACRVGYLANNTVGAYCVLAEDYSNGILNLPVNNYYKFGQYEWVAFE